MFVCFKRRVFVTRTLRAGFILPRGMPHATKKTLQVGWIKKPRIHLGRLTWNITMEVWFRSFSFLNGWFVGSSRSSSRVLVILFFDQISGLRWFCSNWGINRLKGTFYWVGWGQWGKFWSELVPNLIMKWLKKSGFMSWQLLLVANQWCKKDNFLNDKRNYLEATKETTWRRIIPGLVAVVRIV